jgi:dTDP-4-amino-4,6-dideoxygalactose transaminase
MLLDLWPWRKKAIGGWMYARMRQAALKAYRKKLLKETPIPEEVEKVIERVAERVVKRSGQVDYTPQIEQEAFRQIQVVAQRNNLEWDKPYDRLLELAIYQALQRQEEEIIVLLLAEI